MHSPQQPSSRANFMEKFAPALSRQCDEAAEFVAVYAEPAGPALVEAWRNGRMYGAREVFIQAYAEANAETNRHAHNYRAELARRAERHSRLLALAIVASFAGGVFTAATVIFTLAR